MPLGDNYTGIELTQILNALGCRCDVQVNHNKSITKPFLTARAKFESPAQLHLALATHRTFKLRDGKLARLSLPTAKAVHHILPNEVK